MSKRWEWPTIIASAPLFALAIMLVLAAVGVIYATIRDGGWPAALLFLFCFWLVLGWFYLMANRKD